MRPSLSPPLPLLSSHQLSAPGCALPGHYGTYILIILFQHILKTCSSETYVISGYSFGACVAIEVTCQLMARGKHVQHVVLLDGAHRFVSSRTQRYKNKMATGSEAEQQAEALVAFTNQFCSVKHSEVKASIYKGFHNHQLSFC